MHYGITISALKKKTTYKCLYIQIGVYEPKNRCQSSPFDFKLPETSTASRYATERPMKEDSMKSKNNSAMKSYRIYFPMGRFCHNCPQILLDAKMNLMGIFLFFSATASGHVRF